MRAKSRSSRGLSAILLLLLIPATILLGVIAVDVAHFENVRSALLKAADAGALSGAREITGYTVQNGFSAAGLNKITTVARKVAEMNLADGEWIVHAPPNLTVTVDPSETTDLAASPPRFGYVDVIITKTNVKNLLAPIIGAMGSGVARRLETIQVHSRAGVAGLVSTAKVFPVSVSWNYANSLGQSLKTTPLGGTLRLEVRNAVAPALRENAWGLANGSAARDAAEWALDMSSAGGQPMTKTKGQVAGSTNGNSINSNVINNGTYQSAWMSKEVVLPVVENDGCSGPTDIVVGFIGFKATSFPVADSVEGIVTRTVSGGPTSQIPDQLSPSEQAIFNNLAIVGVKLKDPSEPDSTWPFP